MQIAVIADQSSANCAYRAFPIMELNEKGHVARLGGIDEATVDRLAGFDVVHIHRFHDQRAQQLARRLRASGIAVTWDNDDNLIAVPDGAPDRLAKGALREQRLESGVARMVSLADVVTTTSPALARLYRGMGAEHVVEVENFLPRLYRESAARGARRTMDGIVVGWVASSEHTHDLQHLPIASALNAVMSRRPDVHVVSIGVDLGLPRDRYTRHVMVQYSALAEYVAGFDVGLAPLHDIPFNRARSDVKVKEYAYCSVPWLASPIGPYERLGERQGGRLVDDDGWERELERLIASERTRRKLAKLGRRWADTKVAERNTGVWEAALTEAVERARHRGG